MNTTRLYNWYVSFQRVKAGLWSSETKDVINFYTREEAIECNWIEENGERIWDMPAGEEFTPTFLWGFMDQDEAVNFYYAMCKNEVGINVCENKESNLGS